MGGASIGVLTVGGAATQDSEQKPGAELQCYHLVLKDIHQSGTHGDGLFFGLNSSMRTFSADFFELDRLISELIAELYDEHSDSVQAWGELTLLPAGSTVPLILASRAELKGAIEEALGESCCIGWLDD